MKLVENNVIVMFRHEEYLIEICKEECQGIASWDSYLQKDGYGVKVAMFGVLCKEYSLEEFIGMVDASLEAYIEIYEESEVGK